MQKIWFLYSAGHHRGPFSNQDITELLERGKLKWNSPVWKEGFSSWVKLYEVDEFAPQKTVEKTVEKNTDSRKMEKKPAYNLTPSPMEEATVPTTLVENSRLSMVVIVVLLLALVSLAYFYLQSWQHQSTLPLFIKPSQMLEQDYQRLISELQKKNNNDKIQWSFEFAHSLDLRTLWLATNMSQSMAVKVTFTSLPQKILSSEQVRFTSQSVLKNHLLSLQEFQFLQGTKIIPGYYQMEIELFPSGAEDQSLSSLGSSPGMVIKDQVIYLGISPQEKFDRDLKTYMHSLNAIERNHYQELIEKYQTLFFLSTQTEDIFKEELIKMKVSGKEIEYFSRRYASDVSHVLRDLTLDNFHIHKGLHPSFQDLINEYEAVTNLGKEIGDRVAQVIDDFEQLPTINREQKEKMKIKFLGDFDLIEKEITMKIENLQNKQAKNNKE